MDCIEVEAHLPLFVGGDLEHPLTAEVEGHLGACEGCRTRLEAARRARSAILGLAELDPTAVPDLWPGVRARLVDEGLLTPLVPQVSGPAVRAAQAGGLVGSPPQAERAPLRRLRLLAPVSAAAAAAVLALLAWQPWADEVGSPAPRALPGSGGTPLVSATPAEAEPAAAAPSLPDGWQLLRGSELASADEPAGYSPSVPLIPVTLQPAAPSGRGGLQRVGPGGALLRDRARMYPEGSVLILSPHARETQGGLSLINGQLR